SRSTTTRENEASLSASLTRLLPDREGPRGALLPIMSLGAPTMTWLETMPEALASTEDAPGPRNDLTLLWDTAGRPKGRSPRSWRRSTLGRNAIDSFAARRGVEPEAVFHDPGGPKAHV